MTAPPTPLHLLHVLPSFALGGTQRRVVDLIDGLGESFRHTLVALDGRRAAAEAARTPERLRFLEVTIKPGGSFDLGNLLRLRRLLRHERPDLLLTYNWGAIEAALANRFFPLCPHLHCEDGFAGADASAPEPRRRIWARRLVLSRHARLVVPSVSLRQLAETTWEIPASRIIHLPNGIDTARFAAGARRGGEGEPVVIGTLARLSAEKNIQRMLRVFAAAGAQRPIRLLIAGDGPERGALEQASAALGQTGRVTFLGQVGEPEILLSQIDLFLLTSDSEQMPYSLLEAMAAGLPVVASDVGDIKEMVAPENRFAVVPAGAEAAFVGAIGELADSPPARRRVGAANARRARERYELKLMLRRYEQLLVETAQGADWRSGGGRQESV